jgi:redox-sensitive bicupin YhaK (pirin superfamily)
MKDKLHRRGFLSQISTSLAASAALPFLNMAQLFKSAKPDQSNPVLKIKVMGFQWDTIDPFLFCVHHEDKFPKGNAVMGPDPNHFKGRSMGDDFIIKDGFRMYHGKSVPGFPGHPHRGFETITLVRQGIVDHADSIGAAGRYGNGDVQWMTAGKGVQHSEMFPLLFKDKENPMELFQIWINLPAKNKMKDPHFTMLWREKIPKLKHQDLNGKNTLVEIIAGRIGNNVAPAPPPNSWAADPLNEVGVWNIKMDPGAEWNLPPASKGINRVIYYYQGEGLRVNQTSIPKYHSAHLQPDTYVTLKAGNNSTGILVLQGKPIGETVVQYGPFVMNSKEQINQAFEDYHKTKFGGWPWPKYDQVHARELTRFARHADGKEEVLPL